ncbi:MAG: hypothetical protein NZ455_05135 [Bacteroidia bacterium]|nr:hypothetical protein [Bacteroidia bacterium]
MILKCIRSAIFSLFCLNVQNGIYKVKQNHDYNLLINNNIQCKNLKIKSAVLYFGMELALGMSQC